MFNTQFRKMPRVSGQPLSLLILARAPQEKPLFAVTTKSLSSKKHPAHPKRKRFQTVFRTASLFTHFLQTSGPPSTSTPTPLPCSRRRLLCGLGQDRGSVSPGLLYDKVRKWFRTSFCCHFCHRKGFRCYHLKVHVHLHSSSPGRFFFFFNL